MKLTHNRLDTCFESAINEIAAENPRFFRDLYVDIKSGFDGDGEAFVLSDNNKEINISKNGILIENPIDLSFNDKKTANVLSNELVEIAEEKFQKDILEIEEKFAALFDKLNAESSVQIDWFEESPIKSLFKAFGVVVKSDYDSHVEKLINYLTVAVELLNVKFIVFVNVKSYFSESELTEVCKFLNYNNVFTLLLESSVREKIGDEFRVIIDNDLCEIIA